MKILIVYPRRHGCTERAARILRSALPGDVSLLALEGDGMFDLSTYDLIIIGGPIDFGTLAQPLQHFCQAHNDMLQQRRLGFFICSNERSELPLHTLFPPSLLAHATATAIVGDELLMEQRNFLERFIVHSMTQIDHNLVTLAQERLQRLAEQLLTPSPL